MASLRKQKRSPHWFGCITKPNGKRTHRSTGILVDAPTADERRDNRERALEVACKWERTGRKAKRQGLTPDEARDIVNDILRSAGAEELDTETTRDFFKDWLDGKHGGTQTRYAHTVESYFDHIGAVADLSLGKNTYRHILGFIELRRKAGAAPKTIKVDIKSLGNAFNLARRLGKITVNPVDQALALQPISSESSSKDVFSPQQISKLVAAAIGDWHTVVLLGYYTAARLRDCTNLKVKQIDWVNGMITVRQRKTGKPAWIPIHPCLARHLTKAVEGLGSEDFVCPSLANRKTGGKTGLSREFAGIMRAAGIDQCIVPGQGKRRFSKLSFHSLRHSFNSHLANAGVDQETRQVMTGHGTKAANDDYTHLELPKLRNAVGLLPDVDPEPQPVATPELKTAA